MVQVLISLVKSGLPAPYAKRAANAKPVVEEAKCGLLLGSTFYTRADTQDGLLGTPYEQRCSRLRYS